MSEETISSAGPNLNPKEETRKILHRLVHAIEAGQIAEDQIAHTINAVTEDIELIWSGHDDGSRWSIGYAEMVSAFAKDPVLGLDAAGKVVKKHGHQAKGQ